MADTFTSELQGITEEIGVALLANIPEDWNAAVLELIVDPQRFGNEGVAHSIQGPPGTRELVMPSDELHLATRRLEQWSRRNGQMWKRVEFRIRQQGDTWKIETDFRY